MLSNPWYWRFVVVASFALVYLTGKDYIGTTGFVAIGAVGCLTLHNGSC